LLFNMLGATSSFDELLLVGPETDKTTTDIRKHLIQIANDLRSKDRRVEAKKLDDLRYLVMGMGEKGRFLQPDEFLKALFKKLKINIDDKITFLDMSEKEGSPIDRIAEEICAVFSKKIEKPGKEVNLQEFMQREDDIRANYSIAIDNIKNLSDDRDALAYFQLKFARYNSLTKVLSDWKPSCANAEEFKDMILQKYTRLAERKIRTTKNEVLFIQNPRQGGHTTKGYEAKKTYDKIIPSLHITVEGQRYKLQSIVANEGDVHNASWVIFSKDGVDESYYFNGGGTGTPKVEYKKDICKLLFGEKVIGEVAPESQMSYEKLLQEGAFYIYIKE
ncbi:MAG: hypothetical protein KR126chlam5_01112, partial [Candidatus Anoxychlamydiales bacterium]|nr:hypothetical protein [Candidatus Anoxychlamydiales bacterium]